MTTIAVVEDDRGVLDLIKDILEVEGFDVLPYHDGTRALDAFESSSPDLVITDITMPEMDGLKLLRRLREKSDTPVILLTGRTDERDEMVAFRIGPMILFASRFRLACWSNGCGGFCGDIGHPQTLGFNRSRTA
jgi:DNA-binding response OmpR family regulator